jgi:hypothetical protein
MVVGVAFALLVWEYAAKVDMDHIRDAEARERTAKEATNAP